MEKRACCKKFSPSQFNLGIKTRNFFSLDQELEMQQIFFLIFLIQEKKETRVIDSNKSMSL